MLQNPWIEVTTGRGIKITMAVDDIATIEPLEGRGSYIRLKHISDGYIIEESYEKIRSILNPSTLR